MTRESETSGDTGHGDRDKMVQVSVSGGGKLQGSEADIVEGLVIDAVRFIGVLNELVDREGRVVGLDDGVGDLKVYFSDGMGFFCVTLGEGTTEKVFIILSGYSSRILEMRRVPIPEPVPPPSE